MDLVFLDANVLFSAAYKEKSGICRLWDCDGIKLITSSYALEEARRNLRNNAQTNRLQRLMEKVTLISPVFMARSIPEEVTLPEKDIHLLATAIFSRATHLLTGDFQHFGPYYGRTIRGVLILPPSTYLQDRQTSTNSQENSPKI